FGTKLVAWVNDHRHLDECDEDDPSLDFVAHRMSQVTVWTSLLKFFYLEKLASETTNTLQATFGTDPRHPLFAQGPGAFVPATYGPTLQAMSWAIEKLADPALSASDDPPVGAWAGAWYPPSGLWYHGSGPGGLVNPSVLEHWGPCIDTPPSPWGTA